MAGKSKSGQSCAFVEYSNTTEAETAVLTLHEKYEIRPGDGHILVKFAQSGSSRPGPLEAESFDLFAQLWFPFAEQACVTEVEHFRDVAARVPRGSALGFVPNVRMDMSPAQRETLTGNMGAGRTEGEDGYDEKDKGPLVYQESKLFNSETFLINVYDHTKRRAVTFETYGLETQDQFHIQYSYQDFDGLFRFNAELMNPNRKEGRFHWIAERLAILTVGKDRQLKLQPEPTPEVPELPIYETVRKIPTGRMDLKERQRLREQMDMLDIKRNENIAKRKQESRQKFLQHVFWLKEEDKRLKREHHEKLEAERTRRVQMKEELERRQKEASRLEKERQRQRRIAVEAKEERIEERDAEDYRQLRARWKMRDAERAKAIAEAIGRKELDLAELRKKQAEEKKHEEEIMHKRQVAWDAREERIRRKSQAWLKAVLEVKAERMRMAKMMQERNQEYLNLLHSLRQPIFEAQLKRMEERKKAAEAIAQSTAACPRSGLSLSLSRFLFCPSASNLQPEA
ncbi:unnamed protein product [Symbiodinium natans]|uniref:Uncharacterized protein n=1 Tax=Symbiodinium natans TaxID=878477 RepID=A0A812KDH0_9DINO|nr:unnamed protein product [Symbiodinium natans]